MKKRCLFLVTNFLAFSLCAQHVKEHLVKISYEKKVSIDSLHIYDPCEKLKALDLSTFTKDLVSTPLKACQAFMSFNTLSVGKELASEGYGSGGFPSVNTLEHRNKPEFQRKRYLDVYFVLYYKYNDTPHSATYVETFADESRPQYYTVFEHKYINEKWLLTNDWYLSRFESLSKLKPQFAQSLISGEPINGNDQFNELLNAVYLDNTIDIGVLDECISKKEFKDLLTN